MSKFIFLTLFISIAVIGIASTVIVKNISSLQKTSVSINATEIAAKTSVSQPKIQKLGVVENPNTKASNQDNPVLQTSSSSSPDGKKTLNLKRLFANNNFSFTANVANNENSEVENIFSDSGEFSKDLAIPYNSWSPDNMHFFLSDGDAGSRRYLVFNASASMFSDGALYVDLSELFLEKLPEYKIEDVTGWAAPYLLIVNTKNIDGTEGPSFWFDVSTKAFSMLSIRFN